MIADATLRRSRPARGLPHRSRCGGVVAPSRQFRRSMPAALGAQARRPPPQPRTSPTGANGIPTKSRWPSPPELHPPQVADPIVQRFAVQLQARRRAGASILHDVSAAGLPAATACSAAELLAANRPILQMVMGNDACNTEVDHSPCSARASLNRGANNAVAELARVVARRIRTRGCAAE